MHIEISSLITFVCLLWSASLQTIAINNAPQSTANPSALPFELPQSQSQSDSAGVQCPSSCAVCSPKSQFCIACSDGFEPSHIGQCIASSVVENCQLYGLRDACLICKPTYRLLINNTCLKMADGCLIAGPSGSCSRCMDGLSKNQQGLCLTKNLNCVAIANTMECMLCQREFILVAGKCINNDTKCALVEPVNGLCMQCKQGYRLVEYRCVKPEDALNCYIISEDFQTCSYCKTGYFSFYGKCYTQQKIDWLLFQGNLQKKCISTQYYDIRSQLCHPLPQFCERFDYGFLRCVGCLNPNIVIGGLCRDPSLKFCDKFDSRNAYICSSCQPKFFLTATKICQPIPPFCEMVVNQMCGKCIDSFLLNARYQCEDPNCDVADPLTSLCLSCKPSFVKSIDTSICTFKDANCLEKGSNLSCIRCKYNYVYS